MASQITSLMIVYSTVYSGAYKKNIKAPRHWPLWGTVNSPQKGPVTRKICPFDDAIMLVQDLELLTIVLAALRFNYVYSVDLATHVPKEVI